jgi:hypothetical protein
MPKYGRGLDANGDSIGGEFAYTGTLNEVHDLT